MNPAYLPLWIFGISLSWLLPNHYKPWGTFHSEAMMAAMLIIAAIMVGYKSTWRIPKLSLLFFILSLIILIQAVTPLIFKTGTAWMTGGYFLAAAVCMSLGATWEGQRPGQGLAAILSSILFAAILTVGIQLFQWFHLTDILDIWSMGPSSGRPFGNIGQPNQTATFLLWALIGVAWLNESGRIRGSIAVGLSLFILWGVALTYSRTAWLGLVLLLAATWYWRNLWRDKRTTWVVTCLMLCFVGSVAMISWLNSQMELGSSLGDGELARMSSEIRPAAWRLFVDAIVQSPWIGYGANQVPWAQLAVAPDHPPLHSTFGHAHNLFLDFVLWFGLPIGLCASGWILLWVFRRIREIRQSTNVWPILMILVVGNHAMLELPLHYTYFLLPTCLLVGIASVNCCESMLGKHSLNFQKKISITVWIFLIAATFLWALIVRDYMRVEASYQSLRFEMARIQYKVRGTPPEVILLDQWHDFIELARAEPEDLISPQMLEKTRATVSTYSSPSVIYKLSSALAMAGNPQEAEIWLIRLCKTQPESQCRAVKASWEKKTESSPLLGAVNWASVEAGQ